MRFVDKRALWAQSYIYSRCSYNNLFTFSSLLEASSLELLLNKFFLQFSLSVFSWSDILNNSCLLRSEKVHVSVWTKLVSMHSNEYWWIGRGHWNCRFSYCTILIKWVSFWVRINALTLYIFPVLVTVRVAECPLPPH